VVVVVVVVVNRERDAAPGASAMTTEDMRALQLETVKNSLEEYKQRSHDLRDENEALKREREEREGEARQIISFLRQDAERKDELIESLRNTIDQQRDMFQREREKDNLTAAKKLKEAEESFTAREKQLDNEMRLMQRELQTLQDFKERKASLEAGLDQEKRERLELEENHKEAIAQMERKFFEEKGKLQREAKQMLAEIKKSSQEEAVERLDASTKKILFENRRMAEELRLQVQETDDLQKLNRKREEENKRLRREVELNEQQLKEYAKQGFRSTREIRDLTAKVKSLEKSLGQVVKDYERKIQMASESHERRTKELELESQGLRQLLKLKSKELANVKRLAQLILEKRNEVETFLLESIDEVKAQIAKERPQMARGGSRRTVLPLITPSERKAVSNLPRAIEEHVDIADLTWPDRERVLRLLFAKINNSEPMQQMAPHLLDLQDEGHLGAAMAGGEYDLRSVVPEGDDTFVTTDGAGHDHDGDGGIRGQSSHGLAAPLA